MYRDFSPSEDQCKRGSKMFTYSRTCRVWHMLYGAEFSQLCFVGYSCRKILIRSSSPPPTQFHGQIILRKIKQSSPCDSRILRILIVLMCPDIFWEGQVAAFEPVPNLFLRETVEHLVLNIKSKKIWELLYICDHDQKTQYGGLSCDSIVSWLFHTMRFPQLSTEMWERLTEKFKKFKIKSDQLKDIPLTPSLPFPRISVPLLLRWQAGGVGRLTGFTAHAWSCSVVWKMAVCPSRAGPAQSLSVPAEDDARGPAFH